MMRLRKWEDLPPEIQVPEVRRYYDSLSKKSGSLILKRIFDITASVVLLALLSPVFLALAAAIKLDSRGPVFYRQVRVTQYGKRFRIHKFRSMVQGADRGAQVTVDQDARVTKVGRFIRKYRLDEISQLIDILEGNMTFVGTRPEVPKYVAAYTPEMMATLLLPAGVTSEASICYKDEAELLHDVQDIDTVYKTKILPQKMQYNLKSIEDFRLTNDIKTLAATILAVLGR